jgi:amidase
MKRREFLEVTSLASAGALVGPTSGSLFGEFLQNAAARTFDPAAEHSIRELQTLMAAGQVTAVEVTQRYLDRIDTIDRRGPALNSVIEINPEALTIAAALDAERKGGKLRGPLHGVPVLIKDNIDTADRMRTTAGSLALAESIPTRDAFLVERLRASGAILLGKTNLSEWANFRSSRSTSGWSGRGGLTRNPYALDRNCCGSSSGSGAAVAANLCAVAIGTETDGSIVCPATTNGLVGLKPTLGLVSRSGIIPIAASQDTAGPMTRSVADTALLLGAIAGVDARDAITARSGSHVVADYATFLDPAGLKGARLGVMRNYFGFHAEVDRVMESALDAMKQAGAVVIDPANLPTKGRFDDAELEVLLFEFKDGLNKYLATLPASIRTRTLKDLIAFNEANKDREMPWFGQDLFIKAEAKGPLTTPAYVRARRRCVELSRTLGINAVMTKHRLDALIAPTGGPAWTTDLVNGDHYVGGSSTPAAVAGYPTITVPAGAISGLPVGLSFIGRPWTEGPLIRLAFAFEQATRARRLPRYLPAATA